MADLTKKDIKQLLGEQTKELAMDLKDYTDKKLSAQTKELKGYTDIKFAVLDTKIGALDKKFDTKFNTLDAKIDANFNTLDTKIDNLAGMTARRFDEVEKRLDVREKVQKLELEMKQVREALSLQ